MSPSRVESQLLRGAGPAAVLQLLESREMYGYELVEALSARTDGVLAMGQSTLYPMLYNLEGKGLVKAHWKTAGSGRRRKYYRLTEAGRAYLEDNRRQLAELFGALRGLGLVGAGGEEVE